jgi:hypothetical protein
MGNPLVAFALVAEEYERSGDPVLGLKPLFEPVLAKYAGERFDPQAFAKDFTAAYGLAMTPFVAAALADRFVQIGLLNGVGGSTANLVVSSISPTPYSFEEESIEETVSAFVRWASNEATRLNREISDLDLEDAFLSRLARPGFASI